MPTERVAALQEMPCGSGASMPPGLLAFACPHSTSEFRAGDLQPILADDAGHPSPQAPALCCVRFPSTTQWSAIGFVLAFILIYLPVLLGLHRMLGGVRPRWAFPFVAAFLGIAPTAFILFYLGGGVRSLVSQEASLFYAMFAVVGLIIGIGYTRIYANIA